MSKCQDLEPLFTSYVDGEAPPADRASVAEHLDKCPPCRQRVAGEQDTRALLATHRDRLRPTAPAELRARCAAHAAARLHTAVGRRAWIPVSIAASVLLLAGGLFVFGLSGSTALAAQLTLDHMKCFQWGADNLAVTPDGAAAAWSKEFGWTLRVPATSRENDLELLCVRRCFMTEGRAAHIMYKWRGEPLSVFIMHGDRRREDVVNRLGYETAMWSGEGRTYAVVTPSRARDAAGIDPVVRYVRANAR